jgi:hypothetical protein
MVVTQADGSALPTYDGWACEIVIVSPYTQRIAINLSPSVTGNAGAKTLVADMVFVTATTAELPIGVYLGGVTMIDPDGNREPPAKITLTIQHGFPAP